MARNATPDDNTPDLFDFLDDSGPSGRPESDSQSTMDPQSAIMSDEMEDTGTYPDHPYKMIHSNNL